MKETDLAAGCSEDPARKPIRRAPVRSARSREMEPALRQDGLDPPMGLRTRTAFHEPVAEDVDEGRLHDGQRLARDLPFGHAQTPGLGLGGRRGTSGRRVAERRYGFAVRGLARSGPSAGEKSILKVMAFF
jgi:hypothetical protein